MDQTFLNVLEKKGYSDALCDKIIFHDAVPQDTKPGEKEFLNLLRQVLVQDGDVEDYDLGDMNIPRHKLPSSLRRQMVTGFIKLNVIKGIRCMGIKVGPDYLKHVPFPVWRPAVWKQSKVEKYWGFIGIPHPDKKKAFHPIDYVRSARYNNGVMVRECPDPEVLACEDYTRHHLHGLKVSS